MDRPELIVYAVATVIVGVTVLSGPAIGAVDLTDERFSFADIGEGNATIDRVDAPDTAKLSQKFKSRDYQLTVPDARVHLSEVTGNPVLSYQLQIPALGYTRVSKHYIDASNEGWLTVSLDPSTLSGDQITQSEYNATLSISVRGNGNETVYYRDRVTVEVES